MPTAAPSPEPGSAADGTLWQALGWQPRPRQLEQLRQLQALLRSWNKRLNLTRLVEGDDYWIAQVFDSLWPLAALLNASGEHDGDDGGGDAVAGPGCGSRPGDGSGAPDAAPPGPAPAARHASPQSAATAAAAIAASATAASATAASAAAGLQVDDPDGGNPTQAAAAGAADPVNASALNRPATGKAQIAATQHLNTANRTALNVIDVGTGGGFPGLAVAIALPAAHLTLVDSVQRKLDAVAAMAAELGLADRVSLRCERVERTGRHRDCRGGFQLAMARAVAAAPVVAEYLVPLLAPGGQALLYRGQWSPQDQQELGRALALLNARVERCEQRELPAGRGLRTALSLVAEASCPAIYPRAVGVPARQPLGRPEPAAPARRRPRQRTEG